MISPCGYDQLRRTNRRLQASVTVRRVVMGRLRPKPQAGRYEPILSRAEPGRPNGFAGLTARLDQLKAVSRPMGRGSSYYSISNVWSSYLPHYGTAWSCCFHPNYLRERGPSKSGSFMTEQCNSELRRCAPAHRNSIKRVRSVVNVLRAKILILYHRPC